MTRTNPTRQLWNNLAAPEARPNNLGLYASVAEPAEVSTVAAGARVIAEHIYLTGSHLSDPFEFFETVVLNHYDIADLYVIDIG